ncbi:DUF2975 domain-containing protein [Cupriavidus basilensis]|uniref:DUF2975 domain-containing protein n=1 Tax=Cupriavidus basilensis TaxID=68895 RepID=A0ABT6AM48_9BURK|nr:DUF2975 domain-containing protein [Cupriavidus basilensis]MDF3833657.1 DUF2975 domain-containing protein [Cupriavidus basilensis]
MPDRVSSRIVRISQRLAALSLLLMVGMLLLNGAGWLAPGTHSLDGLRFGLSGRMMSGLPLDLAALPVWTRLGAVLLSSIPLVALAIGLLQLRALFRCYARSEYFSVAAADHMGRAGRAVLAWAMLDFLCEPLLSVWLTIGQPPGHRLVTLSVGAGSVVALFMAACITVIAHILRRASELDQEHRQFV